MCARSVLLSCVLTLAGTSAAASAQDGRLPPSLSSDRVGFANATSVAAREHLTMELGVRAAFGDTPEAALPSLSLRAGLFDWLEARVRGPDGVGRFPASGALFGVSDPLVGLKAGGRLADGVAMSFDWEVSLPLGTDGGFGAPEAMLFTGLQLDWTFWGPLTLTPHVVARVLAVRDAASGETVRLFEGGGSLRFTWLALEVLGLWVQSYVLKSETSDWRVAVGGGLFWRVDPNVQLDASFDAGVTEEASPPTAIAGTTILF